MLTSQAPDQLSHLPSPHHVLIKGILQLNCYLEQARGHCASPLTEHENPATFGGGLPYFSPVLGQPQKVGLLCKCNSGFQDVSGAFNQALL